MLQMHGLLDPKQIHHMPIRPPLQCGVLAISGSGARKDGQQVVGGHPGDRAPGSVNHFLMFNHAQQRSVGLGQIIGA
ncbi:hypothetical protein D9M73_217000 [compost metagenome]